MNLVVLSKMRLSVREVSLALVNISIQVSKREVE